MDKIMTISLDDKEKLRCFASALSSPVRLSILDELCEKSMSVKELAFTLNIPVSSMSEHIKVLEGADLIRTFYQAGKRGSLKLCAVKYEKASIELIRTRCEDKYGQIVIDMPVGGYFDCRINPTCGMVDDEKFIARDDDVCSFYSPARFNAQLLWFKSGYIEYRFPQKLSDKIIRSIQFSFECCSEAPGFRNDFPSDITFEVNDREICEWKCPGDFGGRRGSLTPEWWPINSTQYGLLKKLRVTEKGSFLDDTLVSAVKLSNLELQKGDYISFKIGVKENATNVGGVNIFGEKFGNHAQNIQLIIDYKNEK